MSKVRFESGKGTYITSAVVGAILALVFLPCAFLGLTAFGADSTKDAVHFCSECGQKFAVVPRIRSE